MNCNLIQSFGLLIFILAGCNQPAKQAIEETRQAIMPSEKNQQYWQYKGKEVLLLGGSVEDNLFQITNLNEQLDLLQSCGGNYVRNTLSCRDSGNVWPFLQLEDGKYDLNQWNPLYWQRLENFFEATAKREIIVQMELWATFDFYRDFWLINPYNPANNVNYNQARSKLPMEVPTHPIFTNNPFFRSVPQADCNLKLLEYQQKFIDKVLSYSLKYPNILYCMDNETSVTSNWGSFWAKYIKKVGKEKGLYLQTTEMWDPWDLNHVAHRETLDHPETYSFVDISQNNHNQGEEHWQNGIAQINHLKTINALRPLNNVKIYGNDSGRHQTTRNAVESFIKNVLFGAASARFHRPTSGQGINETAQSVIRCMRSITDTTTFFTGQPANHLLENREPNEAYCRAIAGEEYLIYFPAGGSIEIDLPSGASITWVDVLKNEWIKAKDLTSGKNEITSSNDKHAIAIIQL